MQERNVWKTALSLLLVLVCLGSGILLAIATGGKTQPIPWLAVVSVLVAVPCVYFAVRIGGRKRLGESILGFVVFFVFAGIVYPVFQGARAAATYGTCLSNVKQISNAVQLYASDNGDRFPLAASWEDVIAEYLGRSFPRCPENRAPYAYAMNRALSGQKLDDLEDLTRTILIFESSSQSPNKSGTESDLVFPHRGRSFAAFADGQTGTIPPDRRWRP